MHVNGCPNSCARFQVADIGLMSALAKRPDGTRSDAFLVHLGGGFGRANGGNADAFGRKVKGVSVFAEDAADYVETLVRRYRARRGVARSGSERPTFREFVRGLDDEELTAFATPEGRPVSSVTPRAVPFYCPFCGEQELRPGDPSGWRCEVCERSFELRITAIGGGG